MTNKDYETVVGIEVHAELSTKTKIFCSCSTEFGAEPNTHTCPICTGMPGSLPTLNEKVIEYAVKAGIATNCEISLKCKNDRKNYFYPDLPKAYQISQYDEPLCKNGYIEIDTENGTKKVRIERIHIEEDSGKMFHDQFTNGSLIDLNRSGVPLIEIVSKPDMNSAEEVETFMRKLKAILEYMEVSDCKMEEGSYRADVNVSVHEKGKPLGNRTEIKNMNSFKAITRAIKAESVRQIGIYENGGTIEQESLGWNEIAGETFKMRKKETSKDYRYFPEPDLGIIHISEEYVDNIKKNLPELPEVRKQKYKEKYNLSEKDSNIITSSKYMSELFEKTINVCHNPKAVNNWLISDVSRILNEKEMDPREIPFTENELGKLIILIDKNTISTAIGKKVLEELFEKPQDPEKIIVEKGWKQITDSNEIEKIVNNIIKENPQSVVDFKSGKDRALGFLVGQAMKKTKGQANPKMLNEIFIKKMK